MSSLAGRNDHDKQFAAWSCQLTLVRNDEGDWIGVYGPDGRLIEEGHSFSESCILELAGVPHDVVWNVVIPEDEGRLPDSLGEVARFGGFSRQVRP